MWYVMKTFWPKDLAVRYNIPGFAYDWELNLLSGGTQLGTVLVAGLRVLSGPRSATGPALYLGFTLSFAIMLLPTLGVVRHGNTGLVADRYGYLPGMIVAPLSAMVL